MASDSEEEVISRDYEEDRPRLMVPRGSRRPIRKEGSVIIGGPPADPEGKVLTISEVYGLVDRQDTDGLEKFFRNSLNLIRHRGDDSLLMKAAYHGSLNIIQYLLDCGVSVNYQAEDGVSALINCAYAPWNDRMGEVIRRLVLAGADLKLRNAHDHTVMDIAFSKGRVEMILVLLELGAELRSVSVGGRGALEMVLTDHRLESLMDRVLKECLEVTDASVPAEKLIPVLQQAAKAQKTTMYHLLVEQSSELMRSVLLCRQRQLEKICAERKLKKIRDNLEDSQESEQQALASEMLEGQFDSDWLMELDDSERDYRVVLESTVEDPVIEWQGLLRGELESMDQNGHTPLALAISKNRLDQVEWLVEFGQLDLNRSSSRVMGSGRSGIPEIVLDYYYNENIGLPMLKLLFELGMELTPKQNWADWYLKRYRNPNMEGLKVLMDQWKKACRRHGVEMVIHDGPIKNRCSCSVLGRAIKLRNYTIVEHLLLNNSQSSSVDLKYRCSSDGCYGYRGLLNILFRHYLGGGWNSSDRHLGSDRFRILRLCLQQGVVEANGYKMAKLGESFELRRIRDEKVIALLRGFGVDFSEYSISRMAVPVQKYLICYGGMKDQVRNHVEYVTDQPIEDIPQEEMIVLSNGVVWSVPVLFDYLTKTVNGVNEYDKFSPWPGEQILRNNDYSNLECHSHPLGSRIYQFFNVSKYLKHLSAELVEQLNTYGSIFLAKGEPFEQKIKGLLTSRELEEWESIRNFESNNAMPRMGRGLAGKIETLKKDYLGMFYGMWSSLNGEQKDALYGVNENLNIEAIERMLVGEECIMTMGYYMIQANKRLTRWKPTSSNN